MMKKGNVAVIFVSARTGGDPAGYAAAAAEMEEAVRRAPGYLGHDSIGAEDRGITISYWRDAASVTAWRDEVRHAEVRAEGRRHWYGWYRLVVATVDRAHEWRK